MSSRTIRAALLAMMGLMTATAAFSERSDLTRARQHEKAKAQSDSLKAAQSVIDGWPERPRALAAALIQEHGAPDEIAKAQLTWRGRGAWALITVFRDAESAERPNRLLESVSYEVAVRRWRTLNAFGRGVTYDPIRRELLARSDSEETNILALNLADEVIRARRTPADAAAFYDKTLKLSFSGKSSPYMRKLMFTPMASRFPETEYPRDLYLDREIIRLENE